MDGIGLFKVAESMHHTVPGARLSQAHLEGEALCHDERHGAAARRPVHKARQVPPVPPRQDLPHRVHQLHTQSDGKNGSQHGFLVQPQFIAGRCMRASKRWTPLGKANLCA